MPEREQAHRPGDLEWNEEHCRRGVIFAYPDTREHWRIIDPYCIEAYRRPIARGGVLPPK